MFQLLKKINSSAKISQKIRFRLSIPGKWTSFDRNRKDPVFCLTISLCSRNFSTIFFSQFKKWNYSRTSFRKNKKFWKIIEPVIFEEFFIKNWESFKKWKTKGFLYYFYYEWTRMNQRHWFWMTHRDTTRA